VSAPRLLAGALVFAVLVQTAGLARAQEPTVEAESGRISGTVTNGTAGADLGEGHIVELITLSDGAGISSRQTPVEAGRYEFALRPTALETHVLRIVYAGVQYLSDGIVLSPELPEAEQDIVVYETTSDAPALTIDLTSMTVIELDRARATLRIARQDVVRNPADRVYVGDATGTTLRIPTPERTIEATGETVIGEFTLEGGRLASTVPVYPGVNSVVTQYLVGYDRDRDAYRLRATAPLPSDRIEMRIAERFVRSARPVSDERRADDEEIGEDRMMVFKLGPAATGEGLAIDLDGLSGENASNPLTDTGGAIVAILLALVLLAGGVIAVARSPLAARLRRDPHDGDTT
jgi:hypothetical protein